jgi:Sulfatase
MDTGRVMEGSAGQGRRRRLLLERGAHLGALWAFAVARPLFDLLGRSPEFFALYGWPAGRIIGFALALTLLPPLLLTAVVGLAELASARLARVLQLCLVSVLVAAIALEALSIGALVPALAAALLIGGSAAYAYARLRGVRSLLSVLAPAPLIFLVLFLAFSDVSKLVLHEEAAARPSGVHGSAPVVLVILDELPVHSLMDAGGQIDARMFPNLARFARDATWYRNTASVEQDTPFAVPAILDGRLPSPDRLPFAADHPRSLLTLLGDRYRLHVHEEATALCPPGLCRDDLSQAGGGVWDDVGRVYLHLMLPDSIDEGGSTAVRSWNAFSRDRVAGMVETSRSVLLAGSAPPESVAHRKERLLANLDSGRERRFDRFVHGIRAGRRPSLDVVHVLLPHVPYQYLPSGRAYRKHPREELRGLNSRPGFDSPFLAGQAYQRHLLQLGFTDRLLGRLLDRLRRVGLYDRALVAIVADHGISFRAGHARRLLRPENVREIAPVPFFLKAPHQRRGTVSDKPLQTIDVMPTIADVLDVPIPWALDGRSALLPTAAAQRERRIVKKKFAASYLVDRPAWRAEQQAVLRRKASLFGRGLYAYGPRPDLLGRLVPSFDQLPRGRARARLIGPRRYLQVRPRSGVVPTHVVGRLVHGQRGGGRTIAFALNGRIEATGKTFTLEGARDEQLSLMVPERALRPGRNLVELFLVRGQRLQPLGGVG